MGAFKDIATNQKLARAANGAPAPQTAEPQIVEPQKPAIRVTATTAVMT